ncbi:pyridoxal-dependent decarboxylase [Photobacterium sp. SDRW27]|uniref:pyridoxal-dependent decarboxylase n=1 Tax=Photobacterium obscurum TaxID=2829490 RepID=UPI002244BAEA|nr:pyridoxal-dependent decarboxylase [Photobacterium obscurum]MCW8330939.1 pyridoxal-dependent decarboxylase [Photobacterium obscurum]
MTKELTKHQSKYDETCFELPPEGLTEEQRKSCLEVFKNYINVQKDNCLGYQVNQKMDYKGDIEHFLDCHLNNVGDPFVNGNYTLSSKRMEKAVLNYYAKLWSAKVPHDPQDMESFWGYVLSMGSTEGNFYGLWNARDYLAGRKLVADELQKKLRLTNYLHPKHIEDKPHAYTPVAFFSQDTHYSIIKAMRVLSISTFSEIGQAVYPGQNPLDPDGNWLKNKEVPSVEGNAGPGSIDVDKLATLVEFFAEKNYPIIICCNYGSTFKGAYDDVEGIQNKLMPIFERYGLVNRDVHYNDVDEDGNEIAKVDTRNGYWIHVDGALGASYMPFVEMAYKQKLIAQKGPNFDFRLPIVNSIVMSGHKWPGSPCPCGVFMTKVKYQLFPPADPEYTASPDSTFAGSRNGFTPIIMWSYLAKHCYELQVQRVLYCEDVSRYAEDQLNTLQYCHPETQLFVERTPLALTVRFRMPIKPIVEKYSLSCESLKVNGQVRHYAHIYIMPSTQKETIDQLVEELKEKGAFKGDDI